MSREEFSQGVEIIASEARKTGLALGSRAIDAFRGIARLSFEKTVEERGKQQLRTPTFEFSREFIEDLPAQREYQLGLTDFLRSLSLRLDQPNPRQFLTLSGLPIDLEVHWPFRPVQTSDDTFIHVLVRVGSPWSSEANITVSLSGIDQHSMGIYSVSPPVIERFVVNAIRIAIDDNLIVFYRIGQHPPSLQPVRIVPSQKRDIPTDSELKAYLQRKVYWLGFREGDEHTGVAVADPYDATYLVHSVSRVKQVARIASAKREIRLSADGEFAFVTDDLLTQADTFESELKDLTSGSSGLSDAAQATEMVRDPSVFISYSSEDASFARFLSKALGDRSMKVWLDERELNVGDSLTRRIGDALNSNDFMIVVLSPASVRSEWVKHELAEAMTREIKQKRVVVLPVIYRRCQIPPFLTDKKYADFTLDSDSALHTLVRSIKRHHESSIA